MKQDESHELARRYAHAFTNVFSAELSLHDIEHILQAAEYLMSRRRTRFFLRLPAIDSSVKKQALNVICKRFSLPVAVDNIIDLLLKHKRSYLLHLVFLYLVEFYYANHAIETFTISSSHQLPPASIEVIKNFLARKTGCTIVYTHKIDKNLIGGIRLESKSFLWEYSIRKHLRRMQQLAI
jgi:F-type H+-transporting ATPase subunit delta